MRTSNRIYAAYYFLIYIVTILNKIGNTFTGDPKTTRTITQIGWSVDKGVPNATVASDANIWRRVIQAALNEVKNPAFVLHTGDIINTQVGTFNPTPGYLKACSKDLHGIDSYVRQRLRVAMIHKNPTQRKGYQMTVKWGIEFFCKIGLIPSNWLYYNKMYGYTIEQYVERQTKKMKDKRHKHIENLKAKGQEYFTPARLAKMANAHNC